MQITIKLFTTRHVPSTNTVDHLGKDLFDHVPGNRVEKSA